MTERLYSANEVAEALDITSRELHGMLKRGIGVKPDFIVGAGDSRPRRLWRHESMARWQAEAAIVPPVSPYSDHNTINHAFGSTTTWKLWWRCQADGGTLWWFSTPRSWWISANDGLTWHDTELTTRPSDYRYYCVQPNNRGPQVAASVARSAMKLRQSMEGNS